MDYGWRNPERAVHNHSERLRSLESIAGCIGCAAPLQTSGTRDVLSLSAMMTSLRRPPEVLPTSAANYTLGRAARSVAGKAIFCGVLGEEFGSRLPSAATDSLHNREDRLPAAFVQNCAPICTGSQGLESGGV
jgi:hypothetical protein